MRFLMIGLLLLIICTKMLNSQTKTEEKLTLNQRIFGGFNFNVQAQGNSFLFEFSPGAGFKADRRAWLGLRFPYAFYHDRVLNKKVNTHILGIGVFARYLIVEDFSKILPVKTKSGLFVQGDWEQLSLERQYFGSITDQNKGRFWNSNYLAGLGFHQSIGKRSSFYLLIMWSFRQKEYLNYENPIARIGFTF